MMDTPEQTLTFTMPIPLQMHHIAQQFRQQHPNRQKAKQIYLNTIAVQSVHTYLKWFGIETDLEASDSWNPTLQLLMDTADLTVKHQGKLECRPVLPNQEFCSVPSEVWHERIGYVAVQLNTELTEATLLGFLPRVQQVEVPLKSWQSLDQLLERLVHASVVTVQLSQWLQGTVEAGWQTLEALFHIPQVALVSRGIQAESGNMSSYTTRGKLLHLGPISDNAEVVLVVELFPTQTEELEITVKLCPRQDKTVLPTDLDVMILDEKGASVMQAQSRSTNMIQLKFLASLGERFSVKVISEITSMTEDFVV